MADQPDPELEQLLARLAAEGAGSDDGPDDGAFDAADLERVLALSADGEGDEDGDADEDDEDDALPPPLGYLPDWWGPVIDDEARRQLEALEIDLVEPALEHGHDDETLVEFTRHHPPMRRYLVLEALSVRRWSSVYVALDMMNGRTVVLKISRRETDGEGRYVIQIKHTNVVCVHDMLVHRGYPTFVLEWCPQGTLDRYAEFAKDWQRVLARVIEGGRGLAHCHERGLVHGDVKPSNFLISQETGKLSDLGIARPPTREGPEWGTVAFVPPERLKGVWSFAGDVYSYGLVIKQCMREFEVAGEFATLVDKCTVDDEAARPSMSDVLDELQAISAALTGDRELLERRREREALAKEREELAESQRRIELVLLEASRPKPRSLTRIAGVVGGVALLVAASVGIGAAIVERRAPDPVADTLELASEAAERGDGRSAAQYLELALNRAQSNFDAGELRLVAESAENLGHVMHEQGDMLGANESWSVAHDAFEELGDHASVKRTQRLLAGGR